MLEDRYLGEARRAAPAIDGQRQRLAHADVVERLALGIEDDHQAANPRALAHGELVLHLGEQLVALGGVAAAKLGVELAAQDARHHGVRLDEIGFVAVEVGQTLAEVAGEALALPVGPLLVLDERKGSRAHDLGLGIARVLFELGRTVDAVEG